MKTPRKMLNQLSVIFKTLANPNRLKLFNILMTGVHCNCELAALTGLSINLVSHHLNALSEANLIRSQRKKDDARWIYYSVNEETLQSLQPLLQAFFDSERIKNREPSCPPCNKK